MPMNIKNLHNPSMSSNKGSRLLLIKKYLYIGFLVYLNYFIYGYSYGMNLNQVLVMPFIYKINNPALFSEDPYATTFSAYSSLYCNLIAILNKLIPLEQLHCVLYIFLKFMLIFIIFQLAQYMFRSVRTASLACFIFATSRLANSQPLFGNSPLIETMLYPVSFVIPFAMLTIYLYLKRNFVLSFLILGIAYYFNHIIANFILIMFVFAQFNATVKSKTKTGWIIFALLWIPWLFLSLKQNFFGVFPSKDITFFLQHMPLTKVYFPFTWSLEKYLHATVFLILFSIFLQKGFKNCMVSSDIKAFILACITMWSMAFAFSVSFGSYLLFFPVKQTITFQLLHSDIFFITLGLIAAADYIQRLIYDGSLINSIVAILLVFVIVTLTEPVHALTVLALFLLYLRGIKYFSCPIAHFKLSAGLRVACIIMIVSSMVVSLFCRYSLQQRSRNADYYRDKSWRELQYWIRSNTSIASVFIIPPYINGFRVFSQRTPMVEFLDISAIQWSPGFGELWLDRLGDLGIYKKHIILFPSNSAYPDGVSLEIRTKYDQIDERRFSSLAKKYNADYVVVEVPKRLNVTLMYENEHFRLYRI